jgi:hypothetical protein
MLHCMYMYTRKYTQYICATHTLCVFAPPAPLTHTRNTHTHTGDKPGPEYNQVRGRTCQAPQVQKQVTHEQATHEQATHILIVNKTSLSHTHEQ